MVYLSTFTINSNYSCAEIFHMWKPMGRGKSPHSMSMFGMLFVFLSWLTGSQIEVSFMKKGPLVCLGYVKGDEKTTQLHGDYFINHDKDPY